VRASEAAIEKPEQRLPLHTITDFLPGKQSKELKISAAVLERCFSVGSKQVTLALEASTPQQRDEWWSGILKVLTSSAKRLLSSTHKPAGSDEKRTQEEMITSFAARLVPTRMRRYILQKDATDASVTDVMIFYRVSSLTSSSCGS
jgi:hypothetical protein